MKDISDHLREITMEQEAYPYDKELLEKIKALHFHFRNETYTKWKRVNPFYEDLFDWKEKGRFLGFGEDVTVYNSSCIQGDVKVGDHTWIGPFTVLDGTGGLEIGKYCSLAWGVQIYCHSSVNWALSGGKANYEYGPIKIGDCCFIGAQAIIVKNVEIGSHCLIQANSLVTKSFPDYSIIGGVPAKKLGTVEVDGENVHLNFFKKPQVGEVSQE